MSGQCYPGSLDLPAGKPARFKGLKSVFSKDQPGPSLGGSLSSGPYGLFCVLPFWALTLVTSISPNPGLYSLSFLFSFLSVSCLSTLVSSAFSGFSSFSLSALAVSLALLFSSSAFLSFIPLSGFSFTFLSSGYLLQSLFLPL